MIYKVLGPRYIFFASATYYQNQKYYVDCGQTTSPGEEGEDQDEGEGAAQRQPDHRVAQTRHCHRTLI